MPTKGSRKTHCKWGHEYTEENTYIDPSNHRSCRKCINKSKRKHYDQNSTTIKENLRLERIENPNKFREQELLRCYGITIEQYNKLLEAQGGVCAACGKSPEGERFGKLLIDHDHSCCPQKRNSCGKCIRGLLCASCNLTLGNAHENIQRLEALVDY